MPGVKAVITGDDLAETTAKLMMGEGALDLHDIGDNLHRAQESAVPRPRRGGRRGA